MGLFDWLFGQKQIDPKQVPLQTEWALPVLMDWIFSGFNKKPDGGFDLAPLPQYPGQLSPEQSQTVLPDVAAMWHYGAGAPGMQYLQDFVGNQQGTKLPENFTTRLESTMNIGGIGGKPTDMMYDIANYGGVAGPNLEAIKNMMAFGAPSQAGQFMSNAAQFGIPSEGGRILANRAQGIPTAAQNFLSYYMPRR